VKLYKNIEKNLFSFSIHPEIAVKAYPKIIKYIKSSKNDIILL